MKKVLRALWKRKWRVLVVLALLVAVGVYFWERQARAGAIAITLKWSRMDAIPAQAADVEVETTGGMFTRGFVLTFELPPERMAAWLATSAGTAGVPRPGGRRRRCERRARGAWRPGAR